MNYPERVYFEYLKGCYGEDWERGMLCVRSFFECVKEEFSRGGAVFMRGLGRFEPSYLKLWVYCGSYKDWLKDKEGVARKAVKELEDMNYREVEFRYNLKKYGLEEYYDK